MYNIDYYTIQLLYMYYINYTIQCYNGGEGEGEGGGAWGSNRYSRNRPHIDHFSSVTLI